MVNPNGMTRPRTLANAANGAIVQGKRPDITVVQTQKGADMQIANATIERIEGDCSTPSCCTPLFSAQVNA